MQIFKNSNARDLENHNLQKWFIQVAWIYTSAIYDHWQNSFHLLNSFIVKKFRLIFKPARNIDLIVKSRSNWLTRRQNYGITPLRTLYSIYEQRNLLLCVYSWDSGLTNSHLCGRCQCPLKILPRISQGGTLGAAPV